MEGWRRAGVPLWEVGWEVHFDDVYVFFLFLLYRNIGEVNLGLSCSHPDQRHNLDTRHRGLKLGTLRHHLRLPCRTWGHVREGTASDIEAFAKLARGYVFGGPDRRAVCAVNADVSSFPSPSFPFCMWSS